MPFFVVVNMPGYLPDTSEPPTPHDTLEGARASLKDAIWVTAEYECEKEETAANNDAAYKSALAACAVAEPGQSVMFGAFSHSIVLGV